MPYTEATTNRVTQGQMGSPHAFLKLCTSGAVFPREGVSSIPSDWTRKVLFQITMKVLIGNVQGAWVARCVSPPLSKTLVLTLGQDVDASNL